MLPELLVVVVALSVCVTQLFDERDDVTLTIGFEVLSEVAELGVVLITNDPVGGQAVAFKGCLK